MRWLQDFFAGLTESLRGILETIPPAALLGIAFLAGAIEATPVLGMVVPANTVVFLIALHWGTIGRFPADLTAALALGSFAGDVAFYVLGARWGLGFMERWPGILRLGPEKRAALERLLHSHGVKTVLLARFQPITRSVAPYVAGAVRLRPARFLLATGLAAAGGAVLVVVGGYLAGIGLEAVGAALGRATLYVVLTVVGLLVVEYLVTKRLRLATRTTMMLVFAAATAAGAFLGLLADAHAGGGLAAREAVRWPRALAALGALELPALALTVLGDPRILAAAALAVAAWSMWRRRLRQAVLLLLSGPALFLAAAVAGALLPRTPPDGQAGLLLLPPGFPAAGAAVATCLAVVAVWLWAKPGRWRWQFRLAVGGIALAAGLLAAGPLLLGRAWPTETVGGVMLGTLWAALVLLGDLLVQRRQAGEWAGMATR